MRWRWLLAVLALSLAGCQTITVTNVAGIPAGELTRVERATQIQAHALRAAWGTPDITFGAGGRPVVIAPPPNAGALSFHNSGPAAYVWTDGTSSDVSSGPRRPWSLVFSHEVLETLANPTDAAQRASWPLEVCDPVLGVTVDIGGVAVSDFVLPAWFGSPVGPWDAAGALHGPYQQIR